MRSIKSTVCILGLAFIAVFSGSTFAEEAKMQLYPKWVRPSATLTVEIVGDLNEINAGIKTSLRIRGPKDQQNIIRDLPLDAESLRTRKIAEVQIQTPIRAGSYETQLVTEGGKVLVHGPDFRVAAAESPTISKIVPKASYETGGRYSFDIFGTGFSFDPKHVDVLINDVEVQIPDSGRLKDPADALSEKDCRGTRPCLIWNWGMLRVYGISLEKHEFYRPMQVSVRVDGLVSNEKPLLLSCVQRSTPGVIALLIFACLCGCVFLISRGNASRYSYQGRRYRTFALILIDSETNTYSLCKLQMMLWTAAAIISYAYIAASHFLVQWSWVLPKVPEGLPTLLGLSLGTSAVAIGATNMRGNKGAGAIEPAVSDFFTSGGVFAIERLQFFLWTIIGVAGFITTTLAQDPATVSELPKIPDNFTELMGVSSLGYLAGKVARKAGPIIKQVDPPGPYIPSSAPCEIKVTGDNLSPRALVSINGKVLPQSDVTSKASVDFVNELVLNVSCIDPPVKGVPFVKVVNPDGQSAEA